MIARAWLLLQRRCDELVARWRATPDVDDIDVRDPLIDLTTCPRCGQKLTQPDTETTTPGGARAR